MKKIFLILATLCSLNSSAQSPIVIQTPVSQPIVLQIVNSLDLTMTALEGGPWLRYFTAGNIRQLELNWTVDGAPYRRYRYINAEGTFISDWLNISRNDAINLETALNSASIACPVSVTLDHDSLAIQLVKTTCDPEL